MSLAAPEAPAVKTAARLDGAPLGLAGLPEWIGLASGFAARGTTVADLVAYASTQSEVLAREALGDAARLAKTPSEKRAVKDALAARPAPAPSALRAVAAYALAFARVEDAARGRARLAALGAAFPDAPERAADLFDEADRAAFDAAMKTAPPAARAARAAAVAPRDPKQAAQLLKSLGPSPPADVRVAAAEAWLLAGGPKDAKRILELPPPADASDAVLLHRAALHWLAEARAIAPAPARAARRSAKKKPAPKKPAPALSPAQKASAAARLDELQGLLARALAEEDRRRLLEGGVRLALRASRPEDARRLLPSLLEIDPGSDAGATESFREAWSLYEEGRFADAARLFDEQAALWRDVGVRRRATYWSARAKDRAGDAAAARALYASLVAGVAPDLYARWAAAALGVAAGVAPAGPGEDPALSSDAPLAPSREFLLCGFPDLAGDAAELEGSLDLVFAARVAAGTGDYRRAAILLKRRFPELGTPEEGAVPPEARRAFYPVAHSGIVEGEARRAGLPASLLYGVIRQESVFTADIRSRAGALGLMQVMPATGRLMARREEGARKRPDLRDPGENVRLGAAYLRDLLAEFHGDTAAAIAAYNAGPGRVRSWKRAAGAAAPDEFLESIPIAETRLYVKRVLYFQSAYAALYGFPMDAPAPRLETTPPAAP